MLFEYTHAERPVSSWISGVYYNEDTRELLITASSGSYVYEDVPSGVFEDFQNSYSAGTVYNRSVQGFYNNKYGRVESISIRKAEKKVEMAEQKTYKVRAVVAFESEVSAGSLDEAVKAFLESNKDVPGLEIKEVVVPFGK